MDMSFAALDPYRDDPPAVMSDTDPAHDSRGVETVDIGGGSVSTGQICNLSQTLHG